MSVLIDENTRVLVQGITGRDGSFHAKLMQEYGTNLVGGVTPGKGGETQDGVPVFNTVRQARDETDADATVIYVPAPFAADAIVEAADAGIELIVCITEGIPTLDVMKAYNFVVNSDCILIGPNCPGLISPGKAKIGIMPGQIHKPGEVAVVSRSGTLTYEVVNALTSLGIGQSTCIGIGGDPIVGTTFTDVLEWFNDDEDTKAIAMIGEIGGTAEEEAAEFIDEFVNKPVVGFISGRTAPPGKRMGHAGAIISGGQGTAESKVEKLNSVGVEVAQTPTQVADLIKKVLS